MSKIYIFALMATVVLYLGAASSGSGSDAHFASNITLPEDMFLSVTELIKYWGYPVETHEVRTDDGYYLTLHRIPHGKSNKSKVMANGKNGPKPVMFLLPGLLLDSTTFVMNLPHQSLGYVLADAGYDVWIGNNRGNTLSKKHQFLSINSTEFWDFCFDDMSKYDLPTMVDYVLQNTHQTQLYYIGYSQGTTIAFSGFSDNAKLQKKIKKFFAFAPIARSAHLPPWLMRMFVTLITEVLKKYNIHELLPHNHAIDFLAEIACPLEPELCRDLIVLQCGGQTANFNATRVPLYLMHTPAGTSVKNMEHYAQVIYSNEFKKFDYGWFGNLIWYGSFQPPTYDLTKLVVPTVLFSGTGDPAANPRDVEWIASQLPYVERVVIEGYGHADFFLGIDARKKVYEKLISMAN